MSSMLSFFKPLQIWKSEIKPHFTHCTSKHTILSNSLAGRRHWASLSDTSVPQRWWYLSHWLNVRACGQAQTTPTAERWQWESSSDACRNINSNFYFSDFTVLECFLLTKSVFLLCVLMLRESKVCPFHKLLLYLIIYKVIVVIKGQIKGYGWNKIRFFPPPTYIMNISY